MQLLKNHKFDLKISMVESIQITDYPMLSLDVINEINKMRVKEFFALIEIYDEWILKYTKTKHRWTIADRVLKYTGLFVGCVTVVVGSLTLPGLTPIITTASGAIVVFVTHANSIGITNKKKNCYRDIVNHINLEKSKLYMYQRRVLADRILSEDEINLARTMINATKSEIWRIKNKKYRK